MELNTKNGGTPDPAEIEVHPAADLFPMIEGAEFDELVADVRANGLRTPILLDRDGRLLDGRNRLRACRAAGIEPRFATWEGAGSPLELIVSLNLRRRHLNESQRAMLAAQVKEKLAQEGGANWPRLEILENTARLLSISPKSVKRASRVLRSGDKNLILLVQSGEIAVSAAAQKLLEQSARASAASAPPEGAPRFAVLQTSPRWERQKLERLAALRVSDLAAEDAVLFLDAPDHALADAMRLIERWGFHYEASIILLRRARCGRYTRSQHDLILIASRGRPPAPSSTPDSLAPGAPDLAAILEKMFPGQPRANALDARSRRVR